MFRKNQENVPEDGEENKPDQCVYADLFDAVEQMDFDRVASVDGIDDEIELMRFQIRKTIEGEANPDLKLIIQAANSVERMVRTRYRITTEQRQYLRDNVKGVIKQILMPIGLTILNKVIGG